MNQTERHLEGLLGRDALVLDNMAQERYLIDWMRTSPGATEAIVRPSSIVDLAKCVVWCGQHGIGIVPQGGHTGLAGGATPTGAARQVVISLERLNKIREIDLIANTITVEAGVILQDVQNAAFERGRMFPLSLGAEGSCQVGGCIASNAGGTAVLRYGNMRELVLGLETVLPDGTVWSRLRTLRKDNAGFDLKQLFIGTEGTLGIVTAASLRLFPRARQKLVAMIGLPNAEAVLEMFVRVRDAFDAELTGFEFMTGECMNLSCKHLGRAVPLHGPIPFAVLLELASPHTSDDSGAELLESLEAASRAGIVTDAVLASSEQQAQTLWAIRESIPEAMIRQYPQFSAHDVSLPISRIPTFMADVEFMLSSRWPELATVLFGHVGDGNLHLNFVPAEPMEPSRFGVAKHEITEAVYQLVVESGGSISAEHGIGSQKLEMFHKFESPAHLALMTALKTALDPNGLMNPGKVFRAA